MTIHILTFKEMRVKGMYLLTNSGKLDKLIKSGQGSNLAAIGIRN